MQKGLKTIVSALTVLFVVSFLSVIVNAAPTIIEEGDVRGEFGFHWYYYNDKTLEIKPESFSFYQDGSMNVKISLDRMDSEHLPEATTLIINMGAIPRNTINYLYIDACGLCNAKKIDLTHCLFEDFDRIRVSNFAGFLSQFNANRHLNVKEFEFNSNDSVSIPEIFFDNVDCETCKIVSCSSLVSVFVPDSINDLEIKNCSQLMAIYAHGSNESIKVTECPGVKMAEINGELDEFYLSGADNLVKLVFPDCLQYLTINNASNFEKFVYTENMAYCQYNNTGLKEITIPESGEFHIASNKLLTKVTIAAGRTEINQLMFYKCPGLASIKIPEGVQTIDEQAFSSCAGLKTVVLPASLTEIGLSAFENCGRISDVYFAGTQAQLNSIDVYSTEDPGTSYTMSDVFGSNVTIHCRTALKITSQPKDYSGIAGETATFKVTAKGDALSYQWQYYSKGKWVDSSELGAKTARVYADITNSRNGLKYRCVVTDIYGNTVTSQAAKIIVETPLVITKNPENFTGPVGSTATFSVEAEGDELKYQWQYYSKGTWKNSGAAGNKTPQISVDVTSSRDGMKFRCVVTDKYGNEVISDAAVIYARTILEISKQPEDFTGPVGSKATFGIEAKGDGLKYQWQYYSGGTWKNSGAAGNKTPQITVDVTSARDGMKFRCVVTDKYGNKEISEAAAVHAKTELDITVQPEDFTGPLGSKAAFSIEAKGDGLKYQWQYYSKGTWKNSGTTGNKTSQITVDITNARDGMKFRCVVTDKYGATVTSEEAAIHVANQYTTAEQPSDYNEPVYFTATVTEETAEEESDEQADQCQYSPNDNDWFTSGEPGSKVNTILNTDTLEC